MHEHDVVDVPVNPPQQHFFIKNSHPATQALRQTGDPRLYKLPGTIATRSSPERSIRFGRILPRLRDTHVADQHVTELRKLVQAPAAQNRPKVKIFSSPAFACRASPAAFAGATTSNETSASETAALATACALGRAAEALAPAALASPPSACHPPAPAPPTFSPPRQKP